MSLKLKFVTIISFFLIAFVVIAIFVSKPGSFAFKTNADKQYSLTLSSYSGNPVEVYRSKTGYDFTFTFFNCHTVTEGFIETEEGSSIRSNTPIKGITSLLVTASNAPSETFLEYNIYLNDSIQKTDLNHQVNQTFNVDVSSNGFAVTFPCTLVITSLVIEYSCTL